MAGHRSAPDPYGLGFVGIDSVSAQGSWIVGWKVVTA